MNQTFSKIWIVAIVIILAIGGIFAWQYFSAPESEVAIPPEGQPSKDGCMITGCSAQICSDEGVITTCEYLPQYACYKNAVCERQSNGKCGWTQTNELTQCLQDKGTNFPFLQ